MHTPQLCDLVIASLGLTSLLCKNRAHESKAEEEEDDDDEEDEEEMMISLEEPCRCGCA